jgi:hypothetical protein
MIQCQMWTEYDHVISTCPQGCRSRRCEKEGTRKKQGFYFCEEHYKDFVRCINGGKRGDDES